MSGPVPPILWYLLRVMAGVSVGGKLNEVAHVAVALIAVAMAVTVYAPVLMRLLRRHI